MNSIDTVVGGYKDSCNATLGWGVLAGPLALMAGAAGHWLLWVFAIVLVLAWAVQTRNSRPPVRALRLAGESAAKGLSMLGGCGPAARGVFTLAAFCIFSV